MYTNPNESGVATRVTAAATGVTVLTSGPAALLGISVAAILTAPTFELWVGNATGTRVIGLMTLPVNAFTRMPVYSSTGFTYNMSNTATGDLTLYWNPAGTGT